MVGDPVFADEHADYLHVENVILPQLASAASPTPTSTDHGRQPTPLAHLTLGVAGGPMGP
jgi:hypothetical protein